MSSNVENTVSKNENMPVQFFSVECLEDGQLAVERHDGIVLVGTPDRIFSFLKLEH